MHVCVDLQSCPLRARLKKTLKARVYSADYLICNMRLTYCDGRGISGRLVYLIPIDKKANQMINYMHYIFYFPGSLFL